MRRNDLSFVFKFLEKHYEVKWRMIKIPFAKGRIGIVLFWGDPK